MRKVPSLFVCFLLFLTLIPVYQLFYCYSHTNGDPTGLFFTGGLFRHVPELEDHTYYYQNSRGYDGQMYRLLAHDPLLRGGLTNYMDDPRYRSRRMLIPVLAGGFGAIASRLLGSDPVHTTDICYIVFLDLVLAWGAWYFLRLTSSYCPPWMAVTLYCLMPAVIGSTDRMLLDGSGVAGLAATLVLYRDKRHRTLFVVLSLLVLTRETNAMITVGIFLAYWGAREYRRAAFALGTLVPAAVWASYVAARTPPSQAFNLISIPLLPYIFGPGRPLVRALPAWQSVLLQVVDLIALLCLCAAFVLFVRVAWQAFRRRDWVDEVWIVLPAALLSAVSASPSILGDSYSLPRINSVLLTWAALQLLMRGPTVGGAYVLACSAAVLIYRAKPALALIARF